jgi:predicted homoserine dehydrogenase-like protein
VLVSSYITPKARKGAASAIEGRGLVAVAPIAADELVAIKGGHIVTTAVLRSLPERLQNSEIQITDGFHLAALEEAEYEPVMLFINHSCEPNAGFAGNTVLVAMRDIRPGEELRDPAKSFMRSEAAVASAVGRGRGGGWLRRCWCGRPGGAG